MSLLIVSPVAQIMGQVHTLTYLMLETDRTTGSASPRNMDSPLFQHSHHRSDGPHTDFAYSQSWICHIPVVLYSATTLGLTIMSGYSQNRGIKNVVSRIVSPIFLSFSSCKRGSGSENRSSKRRSNSSVEQHSAGPLLYTYCSKLDSAGYQGDRQA